ncbi:hypothetical protein BJX68DRAFT_192512 [Aspergillus pseudodeflectus]|uniref:Uncharacterized protein n=1 Tax=Aspergillus pseudodeflectus TaxID=176178 RepID=A0ABR4KX60_9EURO
MDLQPPSVLAQLPRPLHASTGKTHISEVYSLADSRRRKRYEVAIAVDGEAVNLYNIQNPKLVTSYAVPPQSSFSCPPCSLRRKLLNGSGVKRQTYAAFKKEIKAFVEESAGAGASAPVISSSTFAVKDSSSPIAFIGIVPTSSTEDEDKEPFDILAVHRDGHARRLSPDLETQQWSISHSELAKGSSPPAIHGCFLLEFDDARKSLLKRRPDLLSLALGDSAISGNEDPSILLLVSHSDAEKISLSEVNVQIFCVPASSPSRSTDESQKMRHLSTVTLPNIFEEKIEPSRLNWQFHSASAGLNLSFDKGFINFDLSQYTPAATSKFTLDDEDFSSLMRISPHSVIGAGKSMIALYDTQYKSIQRSIVSDSIPSAATDKSRITFINYFAKLDLVVATQGNSLLAFDLGSQTTSGIPGKRSRDGLLIDAIGRGIGCESQWDKVSKKQRTDSAAALDLTSPEETDKWNEFAHNLRECLSRKDASAFDGAVEAYFGVGDNHVLPSPGQYVNTEKILFLLSLIFSVEGEVTTKDNISASPSIKMSVSLWPTRTCRWLIRLGYFYPGHVESALRRSYKPRILPSLPIGTFVQAIRDSDPSLDRLVMVLKGPAAFNPDELAQALKLFLATARSCIIPTDNEQEAPKALTDGKDETTPSKAVALSTKDELAVSRPESPSSLPTTFTGLNLTLLKLQTHPHQTITTALRDTLTRADLISTIHHLRLSLATGGHTTRFTETPPTPITPHLISPSLPLSTITNLLNSAIDAIGPTGWVSVSPTTDLSVDPEATGLRDLALIAEMKSEVSAALAGVEEATMLTGILREYLRYSTSVESRPKHLTTGADETAPSSTSIRQEKLNGADLLIYGAQDEDGEGDASGKLLPLSLKAVRGVSRTKVLKGSGKVVERSKREMGYLRRKAAGKYTFERLVV